MLNRLLIVSLFLGLTACTQSIQRDTGTLNLSYKLYTDEDVPPLGLRITILRPEIAKNESSKDKLQPRRSYLSSLITPLIEEEVGHNYFNDKFHNNYERVVRMAFGNALNELFTSLGFETIGPYDTMDDMVYRDKKETYLVLVSTLELIVSRVRNDRVCELLSKICKEDGTIQIGGEFRFDFFEPLTHEKIISKRVNLYNLYIQKDYIKEYRKRSGIISNMFAYGRTLTDTTDKALTDALNDFYVRAMKKIARFMEKEEILSYQKDVEKLKKEKTY